MSKALTLTIVANMTSNYSEGLGNIASVQKVFQQGKAFATRSRESLKNAIMVQSGMYDDLKTEINGATQKYVSEEMNATNTKALEGGYMTTRDTTYVRKSSFYLTDAVSCEPYVNESRFHTNLYMATNYANSQGFNLQAAAKDSGLMPYQYEYDKSLKIYSLTIDLDMIGTDENFDSAEADGEEKVDRVNSILGAVENLSLVVKGNLDNAEPIFVVGGLTERKTHYFENVVRVKQDRLVITDDLKDKVSKGFSVGVLKCGLLENEGEICEQFETKTVTAFFDDLKNEVKEYYGVK